MGTDGSCSSLRIECIAPLHLTGIRVVVHGLWEEQHFLVASRATCNGPESILLTCLVISLRHWLNDEISNKYKITLNDNIDHIMTINAYLSSIFCRYLQFRHGSGALGFGQQPEVLRGRLQLSLRVAAQRHDGLVEAALHGEALEQKAVEIPHKHRGRRVLPHLLNMSSWSWTVQYIYQYDAIYINMMQYNQYDARKHVWKAWWRPSPSGRRNSTPHEELPQPRIRIPYSIGSSSSAAPDGWMNQPTPTCPGASNNLNGKCCNVMEPMLQCSKVIGFQITSPHHYPGPMRHLESWNVLEAPCMPWDTSGLETEEMGSASSIFEYQAVFHPVAAEMQHTWVPGCDSTSGWQVYTGEDKGIQTERFQSISHYTKKDTPITTVMITWFNM